MEFQYPQSWHNDREEDSWLFLARSDPYGIHSSGRIETGYHDEPNKVIRVINNTLAGIMVEKNLN